MIQRKRFPDLKLTFHRCEGVVTPHDLRSSFEGSYRDGILPREIWDFSDAEVRGLSMEALGGLLKDAFPSGGAEEKTAFIVKGTEQRELAELFQRLAEFQGFPVEQRVFDDLPSAVHWLFGPDWASALAALTPSTDSAE